MNSTANHIDLSIIMPCYNVAPTLTRALDSIYMQERDFTFEILLVDDASEDDTLDIASAYGKTHPELRLLRNAENLGNAKTFYHGLSNAQGDYFCVLDGDDFYTVRNKLQQQIDFLRKDVDGEYVAVTHYYVFDLGDGQINIPNQYAYDEYNYVDFMKEQAGYLHTTTYMYRNIFRGNVLEYYNEIIFRGDTPRTTFHMMFSNKKIRILNFVGSAYTYTYQGIWSRMKQRQQHEYHLNYLDHFKRLLDTPMETASVDKQIALYQNLRAKASDQIQRFPTISIDEMLVRARRCCEAFEGSNREYLSRGFYYSAFIDSLCATLGAIFRIQHPEMIPAAQNPQSICILGEIGGPAGGASPVFPQMLETIRLHSDKQITLLATDAQAPGEGVLSQLEAYPNVTVTWIPDRDSDKLLRLSEKYRDAAPSLCYIYNTHTDTYSQALMQPGEARNAMPVDLDAGFVCGISNPNADTLLARRPTDYHILKKKFAKKLAYIPTWRNDPAPLSREYAPLDGHEKLFTACMAEPDCRSHANHPGDYLELLAGLPVKFGGRHFHYGPLSEDDLSRVRAYLREHGAPEDAFVHIPETDDLAASLLENRVDLFLAPVSASLQCFALDAMAAGVPVLARKELVRINICDALPPSAFVWRTKDELFAALSALDASALLALSAESRAHFLSCHSRSAVAPCFSAQKSLDEVPSIHCVDDMLHDVKSFGGLFANGGLIRLMSVRTFPAAASSQPKAKCKPAAATPAPAVAPQPAEPPQPPEPTYVQQVQAVYGNGFKAKCMLRDMRLQQRADQLRANGASPLRCKLTMLGSPVAIYRKMKAAFGGRGQAH